MKNYKIKDSERFTIISYFVGNNILHVLYNKDVKYSYNDYLLCLSSLVRPATQVSLH